MKAIDFKSIVIGVLIGVCVMLAIGQIRNPVGRWEVVTGGNMGQFIYRYDTATGATCVTLCDGDILSYQPPPNPEEFLKALAEEEAEREKSLRELNK